MINPLMMHESGHRTGVPVLYYLLVNLNSKMVKE